MPKIPAKPAVQAQEPSPPRLGYIMIPIYDIQDLGGIINWTEHLCHGLRALGAEPVLVRLEDKYACRSSSSKRTMVKGWSGLAYDQMGGWHFPLERRIPLRGIDWEGYTEQFAGIIWGIAVPSAAKLFPDWQELYRACRAPQVMVIHDGNLNKMYPHAYEVMNHCKFIAAVHDCALGSIGDIAVPKGLIPNAQVERFVEPTLAERKAQVFSLQVFKRLKHVDDLVRAVPYIKSTVVLAGGGIEYYYMTSQTKRRPEYGTIWEDALLDGMEYIGFIDEETRDTYLKESMLLVDPGWSKGYAKYGAVFNRTFVEAAIMGCLPAATDMCMGGNSLFDPADYVTIPAGCLAQEFAEVINGALYMPECEYIQKVRSLQDVIRRRLDSLVVARQYLNALGIEP